MKVRYLLTGRLHFGRIREQLRSALRLPSLSGRQDGTRTESRVSSRDRDQSEPESKAPGNLFQCSTCGSVYIADEKRTCPECETEVEQVRSTLACQ